MISMIFLIIAIILIIISLILIISKINFKIGLVIYIYAFLFVFLASITHDPIAIPMIGEISPDAVFAALLAIGGGLVWKLCGFFDTLKKDIDAIKNKLDNHLGICKIKHDELEKRINHR